MHDCRKRAPEYFVELDWKSDKIRMPKPLALKRPNSLHCGDPSFSLSERVPIGFQRILSRRRNKLQIDC